mgnify:CR=1 FL=1
METEEKAFEKLFYLADQEEKLLSDLYNKENVDFLLEFLNSYWVGVGGIESSMSQKQFVLTVYKLKSEHSNWCKKLAISIT